MRYSSLGPALAAALLTGAAFAAAPPAAPPAPAAAPAAAGRHYTLDAAKSSLQFTFLQAGAQNSGRFPRFAVALDFPGADPAGGRLEVTVEVAALDTGDKDRDDTLKSDDLFAVKKFPQAHFSAAQILKTASGYEAVGRLTIRDASREIHVPFTFRTVTEAGVSAGYMSGKTTIRRLDYGVGQGDWKATDQVGNDVGVSFALRLTSAAR